MHEKKPSLFQLFSRLSRAPSKRDTGSGGIDKETREDVPFPLSFFQFSTRCPGTRETYFPGFLFLPRRKRSHERSPLDEERNLSKLANSHRRRQPLAALHENNRRQLSRFRKRNVYERRPGRARLEFVKIPSRCFSRPEQMFEENLART